MQLKKAVSSASKWSDALFGSVAMAHTFTVAIDRCQYQLGDWSSASGLSVNWQVCEYRSGDRWNHPLIYPSVPKYQRIKLSRAACGDSLVVQEWLSETAVRGEPLTGAVGLVNWMGDAMWWELREFFPAAWNINEFNAGQGKVAIETLEIVHSGFVDDEFAPHNPGPQLPDMY
ncbi:phage tail protein [Streptomyces sp. NPDC047981]|uniref:phage tail protein n=1 Tax=Streptomyces sp. NPDC047981 TaxID=3154610 RepID=UPI00341B26D4